MSTYPGELDTFTNPTPANTLNSPSHAGQHAAVNDAIEAIQQTLGVNPQGAHATVKAAIDAAAASGGGGASALNDLTDVDTTGQTTGDVLKYNGTSWVADAAPVVTISEDFVLTINE